MKIACLLLGLLALPLEEETEPKVDPVMVLGRQHCEMFLKGRLHELWDNFTPEMKSVFGGKASVVEHRRTISAEWGFQQELLSESISEHQGLFIYSRIARFKKCSPLIEMRWMFDAEDRVASYTVRRKYINAPTEHADHKTTTDLTLPVQGEWRVLAGGRDVSTNYHAASFDQRFAIDLFLVKNEKAHEGEGKRNTDYFGFGEPVLSPGAGVVVTAVDGVDDNLPGFPNMREPLGNHVIIDHENGEYSFLAQLKKGSVAVEKDARVKPGDVLGEAGNSGDSKLPHVHHHLQLTGVFLRGDGLPAQFQHYMADDEPMPRGEPQQKQRVRNMTAEERKEAWHIVGPAKPPVPETPEKTPPEKQ